MTNTLGHPECVAACSGSPTSYAHRCMELAAPPMHTAVGCSPYLLCTPLCCAGLATHALYMVLSILYGYRHMLLEYSASCITIRTLVSVPMACPLCTPLYGAMHPRPVQHKLCPTSLCSPLLSSYGCCQHTPKSNTKNTLSVPVMPLIS
eukprot:2602580-Rhodomonas_salina.1